MSPGLCAAITIGYYGLAGRYEALKRCELNGKRVVAMKPYAGGRLLKAGKHTKVAGYMRAGQSIEFNVPDTLSSHKCLSYTLDQIGICCAVTGASKVDEINDSLDYFNSSDTEYKKELDEILLQIE
jgi:predicted aldo/keto reductase-like oxidoreductase